MAAAWTPDAEPTEHRPLFDVWPRLEPRVPLVRLGDLPTPLTSLADVLRAARIEGEAWVKRDDLTSPVYGGNKVRTLEVLFGEAKKRDATHIWTTGAFGTNHGTAMVLHAPRASLESGVILFPQPQSWAAVENLRVILTMRPRIRALPHWSALPLSMVLTRRKEQQEGRRPYVMVPGGATPRGALGYVSAALELGEQVQAGEIPRPRAVVIGVGSTCTSAGLLVGFHHAARLGIGFRDERGRPAPPKLVSVRVTPWPVTSETLVLRLAVRTSRLLAGLVGEPSLAVDKRDLARNFRVDGRRLGRGYGYPTSSGTEALALWHAHGGHELDTTYSGKSAAGVLELLRSGERGPVVYWATKSNMPMPKPDRSAIAEAPARMRRYIEAVEQNVRRGREPLPPGLGLDDALA